MRLLALSDIHNNLGAVRKLRAAETNRFDAIVVAGDIGNRTAQEFFEILSTFECPVAYVFGNWDDELDYDHSFGPHCASIHLNVVRIGDIAVTGFSGLPAGWGRNPIAQRLRAEVEHANRSIIDAYAEAQAEVRRSQNDKPRHDKALAIRNRVARAPGYQHYRDQLRLIKTESETLNRQALLETIKHADIARTILVTHERQYRLKDELPGLPLHLFGHDHGFSEKVSGATRYVNVSILDRVVKARPRDKPDFSPEDCRDIDAGNYAVIEIDKAGEFNVACVHLPATEWVPVRSPSIA